MLSLSLTGTSELEVKSVLIPRSKQGPRSIGSAVYLNLKCDFLDSEIETKTR